MHYVYAMLDTKGLIKIGVSANPSQRARDIGWATKHNIIDIQSFECCENYFQVENVCHRLHLSKYLGSEWFNIPMRVAIATIKMVIKAFKRYPTTDPLMILQCMHYDSPGIGIWTFSYFNKKKYHKPRFKEKGTVWRNKADLKAGITFETRFPFEKNRGKATKK